MIGVATFEQMMDDLSVQELLMYVMDLRSKGVTWEWIESHQAELEAHGDNAELYEREWPVFLEGAKRYEDYQRENAS
jgi:hypothetical protein